MSTLFKCIRENGEELARTIAAIPYSRNEYDTAFSFNIKEWKRLKDLDKAAMFLVKSWMGHGYRNNGYKEGFKRDIQAREGMYALKDWYGLPEEILKVAERLRVVQIENKPALELIKQFNYANVFMYLDPPYLPSSRAYSKAQYTHEMDESDHIELLENIVNSKAKIMISGYPSDFYDYYLERWNKKNFYSNAKDDRVRKETIWMNYEPVSQISLFDNLLSKEKMTQ